VRAGLRRLAAPTALRKLRLATGLTLFTYVGLHLTDHALGNVSIAWMEAGLVLQKFLWQGALGTALLYPALTVHFLLGLWAFYERRQFGWTRAEVVQLTLGLSIPLLLMNHLFATRISLAAFGTEKTYVQELYSFWVGAPFFGGVQAALLVVAWIHGCIGVGRWLSLQRGFARAAPLLLVGAVLLPVLALLGFFQGGRTMLALAQDPAWRAANLNPGQVGLPAQNAALKAWRNGSLLADLGLVGLVLLGRGVRVLRERRGGSFVVAYPDGRRVRVPCGFSVLEASRAGRVPHASVCGGRARCSTCRIRVVGGTTALPSPLPGERAVLERVGAAPGVRLACQLRPLDDIAVVPLLPPHQPSPQEARRPARPGEERFIVVLVADMRNSVRLAETRLPFDTVFIIDRFIAALGEAVAEAGGAASQFTGDGLLSTFGLDTPPAVACRQAVTALARIGERVAALNAVLGAELAEPIAFGVGIHGGTAVVGEIGYGARRVFTALGEAANVATRLEALCKAFGCEAVISEEVCRGVGPALAGLPRHETEVRGRTAPLAVRTVARAAELGALLHP
jgi:adenylate cyclase